MKTADTKKTQSQVHAEINQLLLKLDASLGGQVLLVREGMRSGHVNVGVFLLIWSEHSFLAITTLREGRTRRERILAFRFRTVRP